MLSKISTLILGVLYEKERNPYEITKLLKELKLRKWFNIADSTVYATINNLKKQNLIRGETSKGRKISGENNIPDYCRR